MVITQCTLTSQIVPFIQRTIIHTNYSQYFSIDLSDIKDSVPTFEEMLKRNFNIITFTFLIRVVLKGNYYMYNDTFIQSPFLTL